MNVMSAAGNDGAPTVQHESTDVSEMSVYYDGFCTKGKGGPHEYGDDINPQPALQRAP